MCLRTVFWYKTPVPCHLPHRSGFTTKTRHSLSSLPSHFISNRCANPAQFLKKAQDLSPPRPLLVGECQHTKLAKIVIKCGISCASSAAVLCPLVCRCTLRRPPLVYASLSCEGTSFSRVCVCACVHGVVFFFLFVRAAEKCTSVSREVFSSCERPCVSRVCGMATLCQSRAGISAESKCWKHHHI